jgi:thiol-disulfide isomerase/thioredoxin
MSDVARDGWAVSHWFNADQPMTLPGLAGKVVVVHAFQMLCPGCVAHGTPQTQKIAKIFPAETVAVIGLHTVFEHHEAMTPVALKAFLHEYRVTFPVGVDERGDASFPIPKTMAYYQLRGTPSLLLFDAQGRLRQHAFGQVDDMAVGAEIMGLVAEGKGAAEAKDATVA